jgi:DNA modification methylase
MTYQEFLQSKIKVAERYGFDVDPKDKNLFLLPHARDIVSWALSGGRRLIAASFGMTKTRIQIDIALKIVKRFNSKALFICPLNVKYQFVDEDGKDMGIDIRYVRNTDEFIHAGTPYCITNYERVRDGNFDIALLQKEYGLNVVLLDEGSILRSLGSLTTQQFIDIFKNIPFKFVATATPDPNDYIELINYAVFLGMCDRGWALTRFFKRDSQKAGNLTLHPQHEADFWLWVSTWAIFIQKPSDLGYPDTGYDLPELKVTWHEIQVPPDTYGELKEKDGQHKMFADAAKSVTEHSIVKKATLDLRMDKAISLMNDTDHYLLWHIRELERELIQKRIPDAVPVYGSQDIEIREKNILDFTHGLIRILASKPQLSGSGCNFQRHCHKAIYLSIDDKFNDFIQSIHRIFRFLQSHVVEIDIIYVAEERNTAERLKRKWKQYDKQVAIMRNHIKKYGLDYRAQIENIKRSFGVARKEVSGEYFRCINNDSVLELRAELESIGDNCIGLIHTSIPFGNHYEYTNKYNDFGHNDNNELFWEQMDYLIPNLHRVLKPGRIAAIHVKDRIRYSTMTGLGSYTIDPFSDECTTAFRKHGFLLLGRITIVTDVVRENNQTYRLGHTEKCKDGSKMGCGLPEYVLIFRKQQTNLSKGFADEPVVKTKDELELGTWQINAHSFWRSSGNRPFRLEDVIKWTLDKVQAWFKSWNMMEVYDFESHKQLANKLSAKDKLPKDYMALNPQSWHNDVWTDISHMRGLNAEQAKNKVQNHICPLPFDIVERVIDNWSGEGDVVLDPFGGLMTVPYIAVKMKRYGIGIELSETYWKQGVKYCQMAEEERLTPTLFDVIEEEKKAV